MISIVGYNFCSDKNSLDPFPTNINDITIARLSNGIYDKIHATKNVKDPYDTTKPTEWDFDTIFDADFNGDLSAGNVGELLREVDQVRIKRRVKGTFDWITIRVVDINQPEDFMMSFNDTLNEDMVEYEYAFVPISGTVEGNYIIESVMSQFDGIFICDVDSTYRLYAGVEYGTVESVQQIGVFTPFGREYPVVVSNGLTNYQTGSISGTILPKDYLKDGKLDRLEITKNRNQLVEFLNNKKPKMIKDNNGNSWLVFFTGNPQTNYASNSWMGMQSVTGTWTEIGDIHNKEDLYKAGMIPTEE